MLLWYLPPKIVQRVLMCFFLLHSTDPNTMPVHKKDDLKRVRDMAVSGGLKCSFYKLRHNALDVKIYMEEKGTFVSRGNQCFICGKSKTTAVVFVDCWGGISFGTFSKELWKKYLLIDSYSIKCSEIENEEGMPFRTIMHLGVHSIWSSRMAVRHVGPDRRTIKSYFCESVSRLIHVQKLQEL